MATCKDCLHYEVCQFHIDEETKLTVNECEHFKDRSKFIELPCKIGDTVWCINESQIIEEDKVYQIIVRQFSDINVNDVLLVKFGKASFEDFGKTVFLTKEEAERALYSSENPNG